MKHRVAAAYPGVLVRKLRPHRKDLNILASSFPNVNSTPLTSTECLPGGKPYAENRVNRNGATDSGGYGQVE